MISDDLLRSQSERLIDFALFSPFVATKLKFVVMELRK